METQIIKGVELMPGTYVKTLEIKEKMRIADSGRTLSDETKKKISKSMKGKNLNSNHGNWKGTDISYIGLHMWIYSRLGKPQECWNIACLKKSSSYEWANISGEYNRNLNDWMRLCSSCHRIYDINRSKHAKKTL